MSTLMWQVVLGLAEGPLFHKDGKGGGKNEHECRKDDKRMGRKLKKFLLGAFVLFVKEKVTWFLEEWIGVETVMMENVRGPDH